ncbi:MAG: bifunctional UDP-N-acetylglucosamine diphosphorylase/glucosamine-1-phosphate N-acetyltransferase GlmU [Gammaproteobacteria bacterium]|nr:bifunctional UDP-N-acetylglucosamine diphosphorylase/glucosamine-1-phosphate N-acetyltransferase GlmU [Gammaproteobacteria bacterium]
MPTSELHIVILAAGKGTRMRSSLPKVMHEVAGTPLLGHVLDTAISLQPAAIHVVVGHGREQITERFSHASINWVEQTEQLGTGHAVQQALPGVPDDADVLVLYGDVPLISVATLTPLIEACDSFPLALLTASLTNPSGLGRITRDDSNEVTGIVEHKDASAAQLAINEINTGFLCAHAKALRGWLDKIDNNNAQGEYYLTDIVAAAHAAGEPIAAHQPQNNDEIIGINSRQQLSEVERLYQTHQANHLMASGVTLIDPARIDVRGSVSAGQDSIIDVNCVFVGDVKIGSNVQIGPNCVIRDSEIGDHCIIHPNTVIEQAVLGQRVNAGPFARLRPGTELEDEVRIGNFVETKNAKFAKGSKANHLTYVGDASVGEKTNIGAGVITCNYDGANKHQTTIGENVFVGSDCQLVAPVVIGDGATIGAGSTITSDVAPGQLAISRSRQREIDGWQRPVKPAPRDK